MRCSDCNKFTSFVEGNVDVEEINVEEDGVVNAEVHVTLQCTECGTDLKETTLSMNCEDSCDDVAKHLEGKNKDEHEISVEDTDANATVNERDKKTFYGGEVSYTITCSCGNFTTSSSFSDDCLASDFDEI